MNSEQELEAKRLEEIMINATYDYFRYIRKPYINQAAKEMTGLVLDTTNPISNIYFPTTISHHTNDPEVTRLYKRLALVFHPDKCCEPWAKDMFNMINKAYRESNVELLKKCKNYVDDYEINGIWPMKEIINEITIQNEKNNMNPADETDEDDSKLSTMERNLRVAQWKKQLWYQWITDSYIKKLFITPEELSARQTKFDKPN